METWPKGLVEIGEGESDLAPSQFPATRLRKFAKNMRSHQTDAEQKLWEMLRAGRFDGHKFKRQVPIGPYIVDFVCLSARLVIEADGSQHSESLSDDRRDQWFVDNNFRVLRFWNNDILNDLEGVSLAITAALHSMPSPTSPSQQADKATYPLPQGERSKTSE